jgi:hypothetical protein
MCVLIFSKTLETFLKLRRVEGDMIKNVYVSSCKYPLFLSDFNETWISPTDFGKIPKYKISWKFVQREPSCSIQTNGRTDMVKLICRSCNFAKARQKVCDATRTRNFLITNTANLTSRPRRSVGCNGQQRVVRNGGKFSVCFVCRFWMWGGTIWSFCCVRKSLFWQSMKRIWEDSIMHSP